jgi:glycine cleavage system transcriptional repressor
VFAATSVDKQTKHSLVLTAIGTDRPGLVNSITLPLHQAGANVEDARMTILGGEFALLMLVTGTQAVLDAVEETVARLERELKLSVVTRRTKRGSVGQYLSYRLQVTGFDRPGIVHAVSALLAQHQVNVASLDTRLSYAPHSGTPMFVLQAELQVPSQAVLREVRRGLDKLSLAEDLDHALEARG